MEYCVTGIKIFIQVWFEEIIPIVIEKIEIENQKMSLRIDFWQFQSITFLTWPEAKFLELKNFWAFEFLLEQVLMKKTTTFILIFWVWKVWKISQNGSFWMLLLIEKSHFVEENKGSGIILSFAIRGGVDWIFMVEFDLVELKTVVFKLEKLDELRPMSFADFCVLWKIWLTADDQGT